MQHVQNSIKTFLGFPKIKFCQPVFLCCMEAYLISEVFVTEIWPSPYEIRCMVFHNLACLRSKSKPFTMDLYFQQMCLFESLGHASSPLFLCNSTRAVSLEGAALHNLSFAAEMCFN